MRTAFFSSLMFALLTSASVAVSAAPSPTPVVAEAPVSVAVQEQRTDLVNLNKADAETFQKELAGIGKNKADAIVAYRESNGEFTSVDELIEVKGIGKSILEKNRDKLTVE
ncbi:MULTISPECIES: ComEA family DNA-binding protein [Pseudomonas syringae group]|uniref:Competence protein ComEA n=1 Tax=Pseudomonas syringae pv. primulae TaxID=251707 RepID=A0A0N8SJI4_9PSED|nr:MULTISPECIES: helix-hairpin-helix domain-containing protein [Pseudomonas syringae group]KPY32480.1 Competence protein ComEA [Pseudomonas syringae pv. primulae]MBD8189089.1 helix-hairpin-helix domain-containing protein [Pseudomonas viridiflava]MBD8203431.1 helix-hairpin-helix domain-containing protein [Pseudomonas viridiflava]MDY0935921.1 helix-hairpin-helix domain-containing protein [Pseudomonas viridiflava]MDY1013966.1 helix-hairpin-helix domain-containing protein [Pseudomonas viridiflava]